MKRWLALLLDVTTACTGPSAGTTDEPHELPQGDQVPIDADSDFTFDELEPAADILGLELIQATEATGSISIGRLWYVEDYLGRTRTIDPCHKKILAIKRDDVLAHELGHALGLAHSTLPENLMHEGAPLNEPSTNLDLTDEQVEEMRHQAWHLIESCPE
jgi:Matrixin